MREVNKCARRFSLDTLVLYCILYFLYCKAYPLHVACGRCVLYTYRVRRTAKAVQLLQSTVPVCRLIANAYLGAHIARYTSSQWRTAALANGVRGTQSSFAVNETHCVHPACYPSAATGRVYSDSRLPPPRDRLQTYCSSWSTSYTRGVHKQLCRREAASTRARCARENKGQVWHRAECPYTLSLTVPSTEVLTCPIPRYSSTWQPWYPSYPCSELPVLP